MKIENQTATFTAAVAPPIMLLAAAGAVWRFARDLETAGILGVLAGVYIVLAVWIIQLISESFDKSHRTNIHYRRDLDEDEVEEEIP